MKLAKQIFSYSAFNVINAAVPFLLMPVLTAYLSPQDYGMLSLVQLLMALSLPLVLMNVHGLFIIEYSRLSQVAFSGFVSTMVWLPLVGCFLLAIVFWTFQAQLASLFKLPEAWILWMPFFSLMQSIPTMIPIFFQARKQTVYYGLYKTLLSVVNLGLSIFFVVALGEGWQGRLWGVFWSYVVFSVVGLVVLRKTGFLKLTFSREQAGAALRFGVPLIPHALSGVFLAMSDRLFLANMRGPIEVGIYSVALQLASAVFILSSSINQAWVPHLYEKLNQQPTFETKRQIVRRTYQIMLLMAALTAAFIASVDIVYDLFIDIAYHQGKGLSMVIAMAFMFQGFYFMVTNYIFYCKKSHLLSAVTMVSCFALAALNYLLIPIFASYGSAVAMLFSWAGFFAVTWILANRVYPMPWVPS